MKKIFTATLLVFLLSSNLLAYDGVLVSDQTLPQDQNREVNEMIDKFVQQVVIQSVLSTTTDTMKWILQTQNIKIMPQITYQAIHQAALQIFKIEATKEFTQAAYEESFEEAKKMFEDGFPQRDIEAIVKSKVNASLVELNQDPVYKKIIEKIIEQALIKQQQMIAMTVMQRQAQMQMIQKSLAGMLGNIQNEYKEAVEEVRGSSSLW